MTEFWHPHQLKDICEQITDGKHGDCLDEPNSGFYFLSAKDVMDGDLIYGSARQITQTDFSETHRRTKLVPNDILFTNSGTIGRMAIAKKNDRTERTTFQKSVAILKPKGSQVEPRFLYYVLRYDNSKLSDLAVGAAQKNLLLVHLRNFSVTLPPLPVQRKISAILSTYDDLIENNARRIQILEEMAQMLYREWFVHFRFPGHEQSRMVESAMGLIPEGWKVTKLSDVAFLVMGQSPTSDLYNLQKNGLPFHQGVADFGSRFPSDRVYTTALNRIAEKGDILFSVRAPVGRINIATKKIVIGRGVSAIRSKLNTQCFLFQQLKDTFQQEDSMGNGAIFKSVTKGDMEGIQLLAPSANAVLQFESIVRPAFREIEILNNKNTILRQTRDLLLPKLISGEVDVADLDIETGEVGTGGNA